MGTKPYIQNYGRHIYLKLAWNIFSGVVSSMYSAGPQSASYFPAVCNTLGEQKVSLYITREGAVTCDAQILRCRDNVAREKRAMPLSMAFKRLYLWGLLNIKLVLSSTNYIHIN